MQVYAIDLALQNLLNNFLNVLAHSQLRALLSRSDLGILCFWLPLLESFFQGILFVVVLHHLLRCHLKSFLESLSALSLSLSLSLSCFSQASKSKGFLETIWSMVKPEVLESGGYTPRPTPSGIGTRSYETGSLHTFALATFPNGSGRAIDACNQSRQSTSTSRLQWSVGVTSCYRVLSAPAKVTPKTSTRKTTPRAGRPAKQM